MGGAMVIMRPPVHEHDALSIELIRDGLSTATVGRHMYLFGEVPSTTSVVRKLVAAGAEEGTVVLAERVKSQPGEARCCGTPGTFTLHAAVLMPPLRDLGLDTDRIVGELALREAVRDAGGTPTTRDPADGETGRTRLRVRAECVGAAAVLILDAALVPGRWPVRRNPFVASVLNALDRWLELARTEPLLFAEPRLSFGGERVQSSAASGEGSRASAVLHGAALGSRWGTAAAEEASGRDRREVSVVASR
jgi:hypothetical protein